MTKIKTTIGFLIIVLMAGISLLILPQADFAQTPDTKQTGCQAKHEDDDDDDGDEKANQSKYAKEAKITMAEAQAIALKRVPGTILEGELEKERGRLQYAFDICSENNQIFDVEIDAQTGEVLKAGLDDEDDDDDGDSMSVNKKHKEHADKKTRKTMGKNKKIGKNQQPIKN